MTIFLKKLNHKFAGFHCRVFFPPHILHLEHKHLGIQVLAI